MIDKHIEQERQNLRDQAEERESISDLRNRLQRQRIIKRVRFNAEGFLNKDSFWASRYNEDTLKRELPRIFSKHGWDNFPEMNTLEEVYDFVRNDPLFAQFKKSNPHHSLVEMTKYLSLKTVGGVSPGELVMQDLRGQDFDGEILEGVSFRHSDLRGSTFKRAEIVDVNFERTDLRNTDFTLSEIKDTTFFGHDFGRSKFKDVTLTNCIFQTSSSFGEFERVYSEECQFEYVNLSRLDLRNCEFHSCTMANVEMEECNLKRVEMVGSKILLSNLKGADLTRANLRGVHLLGCDLRGVDLTGADLSGTRFEKCKLQGAILKNVSFDKMRTSLAGSNIEGAYISFKSQQDYSPRVRREISGGLGREKSTTGVLRSDSEYYNYSLMTHY